MTGMHIKSNEVEGYATNFIGALKGRFGFVQPRKKRIDVYTHFIGVVMGFRVFEMGEPRVINLKASTWRKVSL